MSIDSDFDSDYYCAKSTTVEEDLDEECVPVQSDDNINQEDQVRHKLFYIEISEYILLYRQTRVICVQVSCLLF